MKLIDLLANELTSWPEQGSGCNYCVADSLGEVFFGNGSMAKLSQAPEDHETARVTKTQWQATRWTGQDGSLPPVGLTVETLWSRTTGEYVTAKVLAHDESRAVYRITSGERKGEYQSDVQHTSFGENLPVFRPIRTAEQIAAEERKEAVAEMASRFALFDKPEVDWWALFDQIYRAGYRKQEQTK